MNDEGLLRCAIELARESVRTGGSPFGALVVREARIIARGSNRVVANADPTAHAGVVALRAATRAPGTHVLTGCVLYSPCDPCPMCYGALRWARIDRLASAATATMRPRPASTTPGSTKRWPVRKRGAG